MPASTPIFGLPYQVGTDPPCFGPGTGCDNLETLWCDFAGIVEGQLDAVDAVVGRTATAIPMARVRRVNNTATNPLLPLSDVFASGFLEFDEVEFDTDNMATLPQGITPRRNGIYRIDATLSADSPDEIGLATSFQISIGTFSFDPDIATLNQVTYLNGFLAPRASTLYEFSNTAPVPRVIMLAEQSGYASTASFFSASLTVYWHSDL